MNPQDLKDKIKQIVSQKYNASSEISLDEPIEQSITLSYEKFPILTKFPELKEQIVNLLTEQYDLFIKDIQWVAPRPTTFRIVFNNDEIFYLLYSNKNWLAEVSGKKYNLKSTGEEGRCAEQISRLLYYGSNEVEKLEPGDEDELEEKPKNEPKTEEEPQ